MLWVVANSLSAGTIRQQVQDPPKTVPESSDYGRTSSHAEVMSFLAELQAFGDERLVFTNFGTTPEGRTLPLVIAADPPVRNAREAILRPQPRVLIQANIHAGEVEGKEVCLEILRDIVWNKSAHPYGIQDLIVLFAPIYNADGNDRFAVNNRPGQFGPPETGIRATSKGLDLNRDYLKMENEETRSFVHLLNQWDPHVVVDLHTTNGSAHGYELTYAPPLHPSVHPLLLQLVNDEGLPQIRKRVFEATGFRLFDYGNFWADGGNSRNPEEIKAWVTFDHRPRFGNNYVGLRNRIAILSEAYSYRDFKTRIAVTKAFVVEILRWCAEQGDRIPEHCAAWDRDTVEQVRTGELMQSTGAQMIPRGGPETVLFRPFEDRLDEASGARYRVSVGPTQEIQVPCLVRFAATAEKSIPAAYWMPPDQKSIVEHLEWHGLEVERTAVAQQIHLEIYRVRTTEVRPRAFQGHQERQVVWEKTTRLQTMPAGSYRVTTHQPLARLLFHLLDPEADDGLVNWNFFDAALEAGPGAELPVYVEWPD